MSQLIFQNAPDVTIATNTFINVPRILRFEDVNLIEIVRDLKVGFTTQIPIYHPDGTYLAKATGNRLYLTNDGKKTNLKINKLANVWECKLDKKTLFEIHIQSGDAFRTLAELYTPEGYFVKCSDSPTPGLIDMKGNQLNVSGLIMSGNTISGFKTGIWIKKNGSVIIGSNQ